MRYLYKQICPTTGQPTATRAIISDEKIEHNEGMPGFEWRQVMEVSEDYEGTALSLYLGITHWSYKGYRKWGKPTWFRKTKNNLLGWSHKKK